MRDGDVNHDLIESKTGAHGMESGFGRARKGSQVPGDFWGSSLAVTYLSSLLKVSTQKHVIPIMYGWLVFPQWANPRVNMEADVIVLDVQRPVVQSQLCHRPAVGLGQCQHWAQVGHWNFCDLTEIHSCETSHGGFDIKSISWCMSSYILMIVYFP